ncbi:phage Gp37/Gp68 family protein [Desulfocurvibacter africanus]|uniref:phage Gp37/Gp68 family protein n=1 Tax=Desulfocurvibacter africanus TaxID=873 RepID=UPI00042524DE|nr:phage Gp37/Gp68 family protein [Desulfocurvibacter africanus]
MNRTGIPYLDYTWNPITGCSKCSPACDNCWAEKMAKRLAGRVGYPKDKPFSATFHPDRLIEPMQLQKPSRIGVTFMGDLFHEDVPGAWLHQVFAYMSLCPQHTFLVLTKRPQRMHEYLTALADEESWKRTLGLKWINGWPLRNVWLGTSIWDQPSAKRNIPPLLATPAAVRWVSYEPALGPVNLEAICGALPEGSITCHYGRAHARRECDCAFGLDWVVCGGESGPGARPMHPDWARKLSEHCRRYRVPFWFKQWGEWCPAESLYEAATLQNGARASNQVVCDSNGQHYLKDDPKGHWFDDSYYSERVGTKVAGNALNGEIIEQLPEVANGRV